MTTSMMLEVCVWRGVRGKKVKGGSVVRLSDPDIQAQNREGSILTPACFRMRLDLSGPPSWSRSTPPKLYLPLIILNDLVCLTTFAFLGLCQTLRVIPEEAFCASHRTLKLAVFFQKLKFSIKIYY